MKDEIWKDIEGYEGLYQVSNFGKVKRIGATIKVVDMTHNRIYYRYFKENEPRQYYDNNGYKTITLKGKRMRVHRLVAETFIPNIENKPQVNHIDGNKENNVVNNLEWVTNKGNVEHAIKIGLTNNKHLKKYIKKEKVLMLDDNDNVVKKFNSITEAFEYFGMGYRGCITEVCQGKRKHFNGYRWEYET